MSRIYGQISMSWAGWCVSRGHFLISKLYTEQMITDFCFTDWMMCQHYTPIIFIKQVKKNVLLLIRKEYMIYFYKRELEKLSPAGMVQNPAFRNQADREGILLVHLNPKKENYFNKSQSLKCYKWNTCCIYFIMKKCDCSSFLFFRENV